MQKKLKFKMWLRSYWFTEPVKNSLLLTSVGDAPELSYHRSPVSGWDQVPVVVTIEKQRKARPKKR